MSLSIRAALFDLGKVLVDFDWPLSVERMAREFGMADGHDVGAWLQQRGGECELYGRGQLDDAAFLTALQRRFDPQLRVSKARLRELWCDMFEPIPGAFAIVETLRPSLHVGLLSNTNAMHFEWLDSKFQLRQRFASLTLSHEVHACKPEPQIYAQALRAARCQPQEAIFVDDLPENVEAARELGLHGIVFVSVPELRQELALLGFHI